MAKGQHGHVKKVQNPKGGLNAKGRASAKGNLKAPVK